MRRRTAAGRIALALSSVVILAGALGCGETASESPTIDVAKLDSGNYPTTPRDMNSIKDGISGAVQESIRMAEFVPLMLDIDSRLIYGRSAITRAHTAKFSPTLSSKEIKFADAAPGLVSGWSTYGNRRPGQQPGLRIELTLLRFDSAEHAANAARVMSEDDNKQYAPKGPLTIGGYPASSAFLTKYDSVSSFTPQDNYLAKLYINSPMATPPDPAPLTDLAKTVLDRLFESLKGYKPTPPNQLAEVPKDVDGLLGRTIPLDKPTAYTGIYSPHAALHRQSLPDSSKQAFADAKVDLVAEQDDFIYRTADAAAAKRLMAASLNQVEDRYEATDSPPGLPTAKCLKLKDESVSDVKFRCYLPYDRYLALVPSDQPQDLHQKTAAQYKLLAAGR
ncbi:DUF7373 family lipoprotein [Nocardia wallacei]|uniref:DUF7373 family lipoprotein n=1 Tax=Nocardia wallacei TaxID=480035 RepID=UPI002457CD5E|nr:hypothetical protein [Nocardia wallacei]